MTNTPKITSKRLLQLLLILMLLASTYTSLKLLSRLNTYHELHSQTPPTQLSWTTEPTFSDHYRLIANYQFLAPDHQTYSGTWELTSPSFLSPEGALYYQTTKLPNNQQLIFFNPNNPSSSSLENQYPLKELLSSLLLWIFFIFLLHKILPFM